MASTVNTVSSDPQPSFNPVSVTDSNGNAVAYQLNPPGIAPEGVTQYYVYTFTDTSVTYTMTFSNISAYSSVATTVSCLAVAGGGSIVGREGQSAENSAGAGAGGMVEVTFTMPPSTAEQKITIKVGAGSPAGSTNRGGDTIVTTGLTDTTTGSFVIPIIAIGGGSAIYSRDGGSGAGAQYAGAVGLSIQQKTYTGTVSGNGYGNNGGNVPDGSVGCYGGGGGAGAPGGDGSGSYPNAVGGAGGLGLQPTLPGIPNTTLVNGISTPILYAAGGVGYGLGTQTTGNGPNTGNGANGRGYSVSGCSGIVVIAIPAGAMSPTGPSV